MSTLTISVACEFGTVFNVFDASGERVAEVRRAVERHGQAGTFWSDSEGAWRLSLASGGVTSSGDQRFINACIVFRRANRTALARRAANEAARWNFEPLPFPDERRWQDEGDAATTVVARGPDPASTCRVRTACHAPRHTRRLHAICTACGVDFNGDALRDLASEVCGRTITSKGQMTPVEWERLGNAVESRHGVLQVAA